MNRGWTEKINNQTFICILNNKNANKRAIKTVVWPSATNSATRAGAYQWRMEKKKHKQSTSPFVLGNWPRYVVNGARMLPNAVFGENNDGLWFKMNGISDLACIACVHLLWWERMGIERVLYTHIVVWWLLCVCLGWYPAHHSRIFRLLYDDMNLQKKRRKK